MRKALAACIACQSELSTGARFRLSHLSVAAAAIAILALVGCGTTSSEQPTRVVTVHDVVTAKCSPKLDVEPTYPDTDAALANAPDIFGGVQLLKEGRALRTAYIASLQAALRACTG